MISRFIRRSGFEMPQPLTAYTELARLPHTIVVILGTLIGAHFAQLDAPTTKLLLAGLANACLFVAAVAFNDWTDVLEDSINKPERPIPSGRVPPKNALLFAGLAATLGVGLSVLVSWRLGVGATGICLAGTAYSLRLKDVPVTGNMVVAVVSTYPLWSWVLVDGHLDATFLHLMLACFLFRSGAEILKTAEDYVGDRYAGRRTVATRLDVRVANRAGSTLLCLSLGFLWAIPGLPVAVLLGLISSSIIAAFAFGSSCLGATAEDSSRLVSMERAIIIVMISVLTADLVIGDWLS